MFDFNKVKIDFEEKCTACGLCVECCPIVSHTELKGVGPEKIIEEILDLFHHNKVGELARTRIYSCLYCNTCTASCPQGLRFIQTHIKSHTRNKNCRNEKFTGKFLVLRCIRYQQCENTRIKFPG